MSVMRERRSDSRILGPDDEIPEPPGRYLTEQVGLTVHLRRLDAHDQIVCGVEPGMMPRTSPLAWCGLCWELAR